MLEFASGQHELLSGNLFGKFHVSSPYLESSFEDFFGLCSTNGAMHGDFLVTPDAERSDGVSGL